MHRSSECIPHQEVTDWIDKKITCHIPDNETNPELQSGDEVPGSQVLCILQAMTQVQKHFHHMMQV